MSSSSTASSSDAKRYVALLLAGVALVLAATELLLRLFVTPLEEGWAHRVDLVYRGRGGDVVLGDSHTFRGFVTREDFVNLSAGGSSVPAMEIVAREYFRHRDPGRVIVAASPQLFTRARERSGTQQHDQYFGQNLALPFPLYVFEPGVARHVGELLDPFELAERVRTARARRDPRNTVDSFLQRHFVEADDEEVERHVVRVLKKNRPVPEVRETESFASYRRMLGFLTSRGAEVCLLRTPAIPRFEEAAARDPRYVAAHRELRALAAELGLRYVDARSLGIGFRIEMFIDPDHLSARGAHLFSQRAIQACFGKYVPGPRERRR